MSDVTLTFSGDDKDARKAFERMQREIAKLKEKVDELSRAQRKANQEQESFWSKAKGFVGGHIKDMVSVESAVQHVVSAYDQWDQRMRSISDRAKTFHADLIKTLSRSGDLANGREIRDRLRNIKGASELEGLNAFDAVTGAAPQLNQLRREGISAEIARLAPLGNVSMMGEQAGELAGIFGDATPQQLANMVMQMRKEAGGEENKLATAPFLRGAQMLAATGATDQYGALALAIDAARGEQSPKLVETLAGAIGSKETLHTGATLTGDERRRNKQWKAATPAERLAMIQSDSAAAEAALGATKAGGYKLLAPGDSAATAANLRAAMDGNLAATSLADARGQFPEAFELRDAEIAKEKAENARDAESLLSKAQTTRFEGETVGLDPVRGYTAGGVKRGVEGAAAVVTNDAAAAAAAGRSAGNFAAANVAALAGSAMTGGTDVVGLLAQIAKATGMMATKKAPPAGNSEQ